MATREANARAIFSWLTCVSSNVVNRIIEGEGPRFSQIGTNQITVAKEPAAVSQNDGVLTVLHVYLRFNIQGFICHLCLDRQSRAVGHQVQGSTSLEITP